MVQQPHSFPLEQEKKDSSLSSSGMETVLSDRVESKQKRTEDLQQLVLERTHELNDSRVLLENIFNSQSDAIFILDNSDLPKIMNYNQAAGILFQYKHNEMKGQPVEFLQASPVQSLQDLFSTWEKRAEFLRFKDIEMKRSDSRHFPVQGSISRLMDGDDKWMGWILALHDITDQKRLEGQVLQSQRLEAMGVLSAGIAHDFNNILAAVIGYAELVLEDVPQGSRAFNRLNGILGAGERARHLIKQILTFSRKIEKKAQPLDVSLIIKEALKLMRASLPSTLIIEQAIAENLPFVMGDPTQIHQVIINLTTNSAQAMKQTGTLSIRLDGRDLDTGFTHAYPDLEPGSYIHLRVSDTGCGISPDILPKIFDPFFTTKEPEHGTGLGLSTVHGIVKDHGGEILVQSTPGIGTIIDVYFPSSESIQSDRIAQASAPPRGKERILVVDDEEVLSFIVQDILQDLGYLVTSMTSSTEALSAFSRFPDQFDMILSDMTMPAMTGIQLTLECHGIRPKIPILLWSGDDAEKAAMDVGACHFLRKPFKKTDLAQAIRKALDSGNR